MAFVQWLFILGGLAVVVLSFTDLLVQGTSGLMIGAVVLIIGIFWLMYSKRSPRTDYGR